MQLAERVSTISISGTMEVASAAEQLRREGVDVVDFGAGEPDFPTPDNIKRAAIRAVEENFTRYTHSGGVLELRQAVCDRHAADFGTAYSPPECVVSVGGKHAVFNVVQALVNPGDEVVVPTPYWVTYNDVVHYAGGWCVYVPTIEQAGFKLTAAMIEPHLTPRAKVLIVNSPNNPSGAVVDRGEFERIHDLTSKRGVWLVVDECYGRLVYDGEPFSAAALPGAKRDIVVVGSLSKTYAMTGWRIGFALAPVEVIAAITRLQSHSTSNATSVAQRAAIEALRGPQDSVARMLAEYRRRRDFVISRLRALPGVTAALPEGAFYAYPNVGALIGRDGLRDSAQFARRLLAEARVAVVPGQVFGTDSHVRISYATSMEELRRGLDRIEQFVRSLAA